MLSNIDKTATYTEWDTVKQFRTLVDEKLLTVPMTDDELTILQEGCDFLDNMVESAEEDDLIKER